MKKDLEKFQAFFSEMGISTDFSRDATGVVLRIKSGMEFHFTKRGAFFAIKLPDGHMIPRGSL